MNIAEQAYHDGQECRKANGKQIAGEALENQAMEEFWHTASIFNTGNTITITGCLVINLLRMSRKNRRL